jgi:hypothetical protein
MKKHARFVFLALLAMFVLLSAFGPTPVAAANGSAACDVILPKLSTCSDNGMSCQALRKVAELLGCRSGSGSGSSSSS